MKYVLLGSLGPGWAARQKERLESARKKADELGIKFESIHYVQGEFDFVDVVEAPDAEAVLAFSVWYVQQGYGRFRTLPAFTEDELASAVKKV